MDNDFVNDLDVNNILSTRERVLLEACLMSDAVKVADMFNIPVWAVSKEAREILAKLGLKSLSWRTLKSEYRKLTAGEEVYKKYELRDLELFMRDVWQCEPECEFRLEPIRGGGIRWWHKNEVGSIRNGIYDESLSGLTDSPPRHNRGRVIVEEVPKTPWDEGYVPEKKYRG